MLKEQQLNKKKLTNRKKFTPRNLTWNQQMKDLMLGYTLEN